MAEQELRPCPVCGSKKVSKLNDDFVICNNEFCEHYRYWIPKELWNSAIRAEKAEAMVEAWVKGVG